MIEQTSYASEVADELGITSSAYAEDVTGEVGLTASAYGEDVAEAVNDRPTGTLRVCQYNIGHFNMGMDAGNVCYIGASNQTTQKYPQFFDYNTQLQHWQSRIDGIKADILGLPEWNENFGYNGNLVSTVASGIFDGYNLSVGSPASGYWWQNTLASKLAMSGAQDIPLGSTNGIMAYVRVATVNINGKPVKIAVTHLNFNNTTGTGGAQGGHDSRQVEIKNLVKLFASDDYVILCGDFNTQGQVYADSVPYLERDWATGLDEFGPFINGCTVDGVFYAGGFTLANSRSNPLKTASATNSRPDRAPTVPQYPYCYLDNIIVKGFTMSNVRVIDDGAITDHCAVVCDLTMIESEVSNG